MKKIKLSILTSFLIASIVLTTMAILPADASDPTVNNDIWFVVMQTSATSITQGSTSLTNSIYTNTGTTIYANILRSPPGTAGSTIIGNATTRIDLVFNNITSQGLATVTMTLNFSDTNLTRNPYGVGVISGKATNVAVTALFPSANPSVGNASGTLVTNGGTGAFANTVMVVDFIMTPFPSAATGPLEAMFFGTHSRVNGRGTLATYALAPTIYSDAWFVPMPTSSDVTSTNTSSTNGILRNTEYTTSYNIMRSPPGASGSVRIGVATSSIDLVFNNATMQGLATVSFTLNFTETNATRNPYGVGVLEGKAINVSVTTLMPTTVPIIGNATGTFVSSSGTVAFTKTTLISDFIMVPYPNTVTGPNVAMFFGTHARVNGTGLLITQNLPPSLALTVNPASTSATAWSIITLSASATGGYQPLTYQWTLGTANMGTTSSVQVFQNQAGIYTYTCKVTDAENNSVNAIATLTVTAQATPTPQSAATQTTSPTINPTTAPTQTPQPTQQPTPTATPTTAPTSPDNSGSTKQSSNWLIIAAFVVVVLAIALGAIFALKFKK